MIISALIQILKCSISFLVKSVISGISHLTSYIITQLYLFYLENLELCMLVHVTLHGIKAFSE